MKKILFAPFIMAALVFVSASCSSQNRGIDRQPAVAGQFYPAGKNELRNTLVELFSRAVPNRGLKNVVAVIAPHAGYVYSGVVAASSFNQIDPARKYDNIFVLGPSHHVGFEGASVYADGDYLTPLGPVKVNRTLAEELIRKDNVFSPRTDAQEQEHSVEVEMPFLQYILKNKFTVVPIVVGAFRPETCARIADVLRPYFNERNLFVISTDFSHYPPYRDAIGIDKTTADAVASNSVSTLISAVQENGRKGVPNLATSMCGISCVLSLLYMTQGNPQVSIDEIQYMNSGDVGGEKDRVVGYYALAVSLQDPPQKSGFFLDPASRKELLAIARNILHRYLDGRGTPELDPASLPAAIRTNAGAFVTLNEHNRLRGCIGRFDASEPLYKTVEEMAVAAATQDYRFPSVGPNELNDIEIEISVLSPMRKISSIDEIEMGRHGIYIRKGSRSGTFLPQVAAETGWTKEEFLGHCAQDKAGIGWNGWKDADIFVYEALVFGEHEVKVD